MIELILIALGGYVVLAYIIWRLYKRARQVDKLLQRIQEAVDDY